MSHSSSYFFIRGWPLLGLLSSLTFWILYSLRTTWIPAMVKIQLIHAFSWYVLFSMLLPLDLVSVNDSEPKTVRPNLHFWALLIFFFVCAHLTILWCPLIEAKVLPVFYNVLSQIPVDPSSLSSGFSLNLEVPGHTVLPSFSHELSIRAYVGSIFSTWN